MTENSKYLDIVVELQQERLDTFSNLTQSTTELSKTILDNSNIITEAINNMNRNTNSNIPQKIATRAHYLKLRKNLMQTVK